jgi:hypothetical protein
MNMKTSKRMAALPAPEVGPKMISVVAERYERLKALEDGMKGQAEMAKSIDAGKGPTATPTLPSINILIDRLLENSKAAMEILARIEGICRTLCGQAAELSPRTSVMESFADGALGTLGGVAAETHMTLVLTSNLLSKLEDVVIVKK